MKDADFFYELNAHPALIANVDESPFLPNEIPTEFTERISALCDYIFTVRTTEKPNVLIGDCALHHWDQQNKEVVIGGSLVPDYWGKGYMQAAFNLLAEIAKQELGVKALVGCTKTKNTKAIRLVEKMGFVKYQFDEQNTVMRKEI
ncbi:MAG: GNAT family N-acetyltransferase [Spirosoma sp.]|nr:GNAT family N-acetyltransferase [Spirosoma sp.]